MKLKLEKGATVPKGDRLRKFCEDEEDVSGDTYPRHKESQRQLSSQKRLRWFLQLFPLELPPSFSGQTTMLNTKDATVADHKNIFTYSENSIKNLLAMPEANRIK